MAKYNKNFMDVFNSEDILFLNSDCIDIKNYWKIIGKDVYVAIKSHPMLSRFSELLLV
jgi:hypothetical protein